MSAHDELPPGCEWAPAHGDVRGIVIHGGDVVSTGHTRERAARKSWESWEAASNITREEYTAMRAAVEQLAKATMLLDRGLLALEFGDDDGAVDVLREWYASKHPRVTP